MENAARTSADPYREILRQVFVETLAEIDIRRVFSRKIEYLRGVLRVEEDLYDLASYSRVLVVAVGKAAGTMLDALVAQTGSTLEGIVVCPGEAVPQHRGFRYFSGGHPLPTTESVRAAQAILKNVAGLDDHSLVIFMISGGASAMVEAPLDPDMSLEDLVRTYRALLHSGATISEVNAIRKHLSAIKGGRLAQAAYPATQVSVMVSDVPERSLDALASGPTMPDSTTVDDCYQIANAYGLVERFPAPVRALFERRCLEETSKADDPAFVRARWWPILSSTRCAEAAAALVSCHGFAVEIDHTPDDWDYREAATYLLNRIRELRSGVSRVALISGGEVTVKVGEPSGVGGRNQQFALCCAQQICGENFAVLSAGTDGIDGNSPAAGAVVDGTSVARARAAGMDVEAALRTFDAFPLFDRLGETLITGPTGNNVRDLRILLAW